MRKLKTKLTKKEQNKELESNTRSYMFAMSLLQTALMLQDVFGFSARGFTRKLPNKLKELEFKSEYLILDLYPKAEQALKKLLILTNTVLEDTKLVETLTKNKRLKDNFYTARDKMAGLL